MVQVEDIPESRNTVLTKDIKSFKAIVNEKDAVFIYNQVKDEKKEIHLDMVDKNRNFGGLEQKQTQNLKASNGIEMAKKTIRT